MCFLGFSLSFSVLYCFVCLQRLLPDTWQRVGHTEFLDFGSNDTKNKRRVHPLDLTESSYLRQLHLDKKTNNIKMLLLLLLKHIFIRQIIAYEVSKSCLVLYLCKFTEEMIASDRYLIKILLISSKKAITRNWGKQRKTFTLTDKVTKCVIYWCVCDLHLCER